MCCFVLTFVAMAVSKLKIGLCLSGGAARGIAHVGVIQALLEAGIEPAVTAGSSAGSVVGVLYAAGLSPSEMLDFIEQSNFLKLVKFGLPSGGLSRLTFINERLAAVIPENDFARLKKPLFVTMTNLNSGQLEVRNSGQLFEVITASCCIPMVFKPVEIDGHLYVDGGLLSNLPVEPLLTEADFIIGVNVIPQVVLENKALNGVIDIANRCFDLSILANSRPQVSLCDYLVRMEGIGEFGVFQFNRYQEIYELGYAEAVRQMPEILATLKAQEVVVASSSL